MNLTRFCSIIMVNHNGVKYLGKKYLVEAVKSFLKTDYPDFEFIFVDNASTDNSLRILSSVFQKYSSLKTVKNNENIGFAGGCEEGLKRANGDYIILVNNDDKVLSSNWLTELIKIMENNERIGAVFCKKLKWDNPRFIDAIGLTMNPVGLVKQIGENEYDRGQYDFVCERLIWQTPVLLKRETIEKIGGLFDRDYIILNDDVDSSLRIRSAGYKIVFVPTAVVIHKRSATMKHLSVEFVAFNGRKNVIQTLLKIYERKNIIKWLPITFLIYFFAVFYYLGINRFDQAKATLKAVFWTFMHIKKILEKRAYVQKYVRKVSDREIMKYMRPLRITDLTKSEKIWPK